MVMAWQKRNKKKADVKSFIHSDPLEWKTAKKVVQNIIKDHKDSKVPFKLSRKELAILDKEHAEVYQHSFLVFPDNNGGFELGIMARGQIYDSALQLNIEEGIEGSGNFGIVKVIQFADNSTYAVKIEGVKDDDEVKAEHEIMKTLGRLKDTFVRVREKTVAWTKNEGIKDKLYTIQQLHQGQELQEFLKGIDITTMDPDQKYDIALKIALEIESLHKKDIIHCDLKKANLMISVRRDNPNAFLINAIDFGFSKQLKIGEKSIVGKYVEGSPGYLAPEIHNKKESKKEYSKASDMYALGKILRDMGIGDNKSSPLYSLVSKMGSKDPDQRPTISDLVILLSDDAVKKDTLKDMQNTRNAYINAHINEEKQRALGYREGQYVSFSQGAAELESKYNQEINAKTGFILFGAVKINARKQLDLLNNVKDIVKNDYVINDNAIMAISKILTILKNNQKKHNKTLSKPSNFNFTILKSLPFKIQKTVLEKLGVKKEEQESFLEVNSEENRVMLAKMINAYKLEKVENVEKIEVLVPKPKK